MLGILMASWVIQTPLGSSLPEGKWLSSLSVEEYDVNVGQGEGYGNSAHIYGSWTDPQSSSGAFMILNTDVQDARSVVLYMRGTGKYRVQVIYQDGEDVYMVQEVAEVGSDWKEVVLDLSKGTGPIIGGMLKRPGIRFPTRVVVLPYANKETGETQNFMDIYVSKVFIRR